MAKADSRAVTLMRRTDGEGRAFFEIFIGAGTRAKPFLVAADPKEAGRIAAGILAAKVAMPEAGLFDDGGETAE